MTAARHNAVTVPRTPGSPTPGWLVVAGQEFRDLWVELARPDPRPGVQRAAEPAHLPGRDEQRLELHRPERHGQPGDAGHLGIGVAISLLVSADALSGERERGTLETLLLTPLPPRQIAMGKLWRRSRSGQSCCSSPCRTCGRCALARGCSPMPCCPGRLVGALLTIAFASLGIIVSIFSNSNRASMAASFFIFVALITPTQLPGGTLKGWFGDLLIASTQSPPARASSTAWSSATIPGARKRRCSSRRLWPRLWGWRWRICSLTGCDLTEVCANERHGQVASRCWRYSRSARAVGCAGQPAGAGACVGGSHDRLADHRQRQRAPGAHRRHRQFTSTITNTSSAASPKLFANLNFVAVDHSTYVDPEDWSSERTISVPSLAAGASATHTWTIDTVTKGDVDAYVVALPDVGPTATAEPLISSPAVHLHVTEQRKLNPGGVLPVVLIVPGAIAAGFVGLQASRRRR